jgi:hypothetical protein
VPTLFGQPVALNEPVEVTVTQPDGLDRLLRLDWADDGTYRGVFTDTSLIGPYLVTAEVYATSPARNHLTRYRQMSAVIFLPGRGPGGGQTGGGGGGHTGGEHGGCLDSKECEEARRLLRRLEKLLTLCCKGQ